MRPPAGQTQKHPTDLPFDHCAGCYDSQMESVDLYMRRPLHLKLESDIHYVLYSLTVLDSCYVYLNANESKQISATQHPKQLIIPTHVAHVTRTRLGLRCFYSYVQAYSVRNLETVGERKI